MSKRRPIQVALIATALSHLLFTSCVDNDYDLSKNIDLTVTIGGNLALPACSTDTISLRKIFDLSEDESNTLKTNRGEIAGLQYGDYYLQESNGDNPTVSTLTIERTFLQLGQSTEQSQKLIFANPALIGVTEDLQTLVDLKTEFNLHNDEVPGQLRELNWVELSAPVKIRIYFASKDGIKQLSMKEGLTITFEDFIDFEPYNGGFYIAENNEIRITQDTPIDNQGKAIEVTLRKIDLEKSGLKNCLTPSVDSKDESLYGTIDLPMDIAVNGNMALALNDYPQGKTTAEAEFKAEIQIATAEILGANGIIAPNFHLNFDPIDFVDVPEFLNDEETDIDLYDPQIVFTVDNDAPVGMNIEAELVGLDENGDIIIVDGQEARVKIGRPEYDQKNAVFLEANKTNVFAVSILPHDYSDGTQCIQVPDLSNLIRKIPAQIGVRDINPTVPAKAYTVELNKVHDITTQYEITTPLAFGENLNFVYKDTLDGWAEDLGDINIKGVEIEMETENTIPMEMAIDATPIYKDGVNRNNVQVEVKGAIGYGDGSLKISLICPDGNIEQLDGIAMQIVGKSNHDIAGKPLNEKQTLRIKKVVLRIKDGITADLN